MSNYHLKIYERLLRETIQSSTSMKRVNTFLNEDIGFVSNRIGIYMEGTVYHSKILVDNLIQISEGKKFIEESIISSAIRPSLIGYIYIRQPPPNNPCNGAWEVKGSAAKTKGYGKLIYGMGYHMSAEAGSGLLMPDRHNLSKKAREAWKKVRSRNPGKPLDNIMHKRPDYVSDSFHDTYHTEDPSDDCETWPIAVNSSGGGFAHVSDGVEDAETQDAVNRTYAMGDMGYDFEGMKMIHNMTVNYIRKNFVVQPPRLDINKVILNIGSELFTEKVVEVVYLKHHVEIC